MATSTKRVIILLLIINILFGLMIDFSNSLKEEEYVGSTLNDYSNSYTNWSGDFNENFGDTNPDTSSYTLDRTYGDTRFGLGKIVNGLMIGVTSPFRQTQCEGECANSIQTQLEGIFGLLLIIINALGILEIVYLTYSKKSD